MPVLAIAVGFSGLALSEHPPSAATHASSAGSVARASGGLAGIHESAGPVSGTGRVQREPWSRQ